jgi:hypothetical protein
METTGNVVAIDEYTKSSRPYPAKGPNTLPPNPTTTLNFFRFTAFQHLLGFHSLSVNGNGNRCSFRGEQRDRRERGQQRP